VTIWDWIVETGQGIADLLVNAELLVIAVSAALGAIAMFFLMWYALEVAACWRVFQKARQGGWKSLIPVYSNYIRYKISWRTRWFWVSGALLAASIVLGIWSGQGNLVTDALSIAVGAAGAVVHVLGLYRLARAFGHGAPFTLGLVLCRPLFLVVLGLGGSEYRGAGLEKAGTGIV